MPLRELVRLTELVKLKELVKLRELVALKELVELKNWWTQNIEELVALEAPRENWLD